MKKFKIVGKINNLREKMIFKSALNILILLCVFWVGVGVGQGKIVFGPDALYRKSVQKDAPTKLDTSGTQEIYQMLRQSFDGQLDTGKLQDGMKRGLVSASGDPYTEYMSVDEAKTFNEQLSGSFEGIGAELSKEGSSIVIVSPIAGFPAEKAGLRPKDIVVEANGQSLHNVGVNEAVNKIRGPKGSVVKLKVIRDNKPLEFTITRETISLPSVESKIVDGNIGVITISRFGDDTVELTSKAADEFKTKGVKGIVLDLRGNPGGRLDAAVGVSSLWLAKGDEILQEKRNNVVVKTFNANGVSTLKGVPTVVLIDDGSASASEITAGALRDNKVATLIGVKSFGKGSVQEVRDLSGGAILKVTVARWFTPSGRNIDKQGIEPDQKIELTDADIASKNDTQLNAALSKLQK